MTNDQPPIRPSQDERLMAALSHISMLVPTIGMIAPIVVWVTQKDKSRFVYVQALQAIALHITNLLVLFLGMACYMLSFLGNFIPLAFMDESSGFPPFFAADVLLPFASMALIFLSQFAFAVYGLVAAIQTFQGRDFRYLVIGPMVDRFIQDKNG